MALKREHIVFGALVALFLLFLGYETLFYDPVMPDHMGMHSMMMGRVGPSLFGFNLFFWILILAFAGLLLLSGQRKNSAVEGEALRTLKDRYAGGEITREEYLQIFKDLKE
ncbi:MAG TPA: SHOCT domain-containing protein [Euryarchaeota archaeon]|nr:SHOCT domain-containing protein [Euryarchaeota archaeon]